MEKCNNSQREELLKWLEPTASLNCFLYGDIENFDMEEDFMDVWCIRHDGEISSILLRYFKYFVVYITNDEDAEMIAKKIESFPEKIGISAISSVVEKLKPYLNFSNIKPMYLAELSPKTINPHNIGLELTKATVDDIDELFDFQATIEEFSLTEDRRDAFGQEIKTNTGRVYFLKEENKIVSCATITAENRLNGMIIGVATDPTHRKKGYAQACVGKLCQEMVEDEKSVLLFYNNPDAGKLYKKLGFVDIENFTMADF